MNAVDNESFTSPAKSSKNVIFISNNNNNTVINNKYETLSNIIDDGEGMENEISQIFTEPEHCRSL